jgi:hypothetical protein
MRIRCPPHLRCCVGVSLPFLRLRREVCTMCSHHCNLPVNPVCGWTWVCIRRACARMRVRVACVCMSRACASHLYACLCTCACGVCVRVRVRVCDACVCDACVCVFAMFCHIVQPPSDFPGGAANKMGEDFERYQSKTGGHAARGTPTHGGWQDCCRAWVVGILYPGPQQVWQTFPRGSAGLTPSNTVQRPYAVRTSYVSRCEFMYVPSAEVRGYKARVLVEKQRGSLDVCWARR